MTTDKCFLDPDLDLPSLAARMNLTPHELSYLLNKGIGSNFFEFVNSYRVEEAKKLLLSGEHNHYSILGIAYEAGFNSKTTFNTTFKKATGLTPSQFKKGM
jgi:AraC-like DNA-binding protein